METYVASRMQNSRQRFHHQASFKSFGVSLTLESDDSELLHDAQTRARKALVGNFAPIRNSEIGHVFSLSRKDNGTYVLHQDGEIFPHGKDRRLFLKYFDSALRIAVAEYAPGLVFVHAGAVGWKGRAIVYPADSFGGKSTLTAEFVRLGADYYSDDYAIFDEDGMLHPFPRLLSLRSRESADDVYEVEEISAEALGGKVGSVRLPPGCVIITSYDENAVWDPVVLTPGQAVIEMVSQTIPIRYAPEFSLKVLKKVTSSAILLKCSRNEAKPFAKLFLDFVDNKLF